MLLIKEPQCCHPLLSSASAGENWFHKCVAPKHVITRAELGKGVEGTSVVIVQGIVNTFSRRVTHTSADGGASGGFQPSQGHQDAHGGQVRRILPSFLPHLCIPHCGAFGRRHLNSNAFSRKAHGVKVCDG